MVRIENVESYYERIKQNSSKILQEPEIIRIKKDKNIIETK
jgi:hypothetical protein